MSNLLNALIAETTLIKRQLLKRNFALGAVMATAIKSALFAENIIFWPEDFLKTIVRLIVPTIPTARLKQNTKFLSYNYYYKITNI